MSVETTEDETMKREVPPRSQRLSTGDASGSPVRWHLERIVAELRASREDTHSIRRDGEPRRAPSRDALETILNDLTEASTISSAIPSASCWIPCATRSIAARYSLAMSCCPGSAARMPSN
jgi:hypothetical protein